MSTGFFAILDDVASLSKIVASSIDDIAAKAAKAGSKAAGIVIDDAAVTPRYVVGLASERELPIIWQIAKGSLKNKLLFLLPGALVLSFLAPWAITPLLMIGGLYLCLEGFHKVLDLVRPHAAHDEAPDPIVAIESLVEFEKTKIASAVRTDFILSAEIMAISLAMVSDSAIWTQALLLAIVGVGMTALVYGAVAIIVKADDFGAYLAQSASATTRRVGLAIVKGMPGFLRGLTYVGMLAMLWVGGGILVHGAHVLGWHAPEEAVHALAEAAHLPVPVLGGLLKWLVGALLAALAGLFAGSLVAMGEKYAFAPALAWLARRRVTSQRP